jgi:hypothetical protein
MALTQTDRQTVLRARRIPKCYGPVQEGDIWRIRNNEDLNRSINGEDIVKFLKAQRIRWLGHVKRVEGGAMPRKMMEGRVFVGRRRGRPHLRWMDDVADLKVMKIKQWTEKTKEESRGDQGSLRAVALRGRKKHI